MIRGVRVVQVAYVIQVVQVIKVVRLVRLNGMHSKSICCTYWPLLFWLVVLLYMMAVKMTKINNPEILFPVGWQQGFTRIFHD